jgi:radical SAM superfamily enzyme YgiQ (UPF0313 family)
MACNVLLVAPAFPGNTFWHLGATCAVSGVRHTQPPLGLLTVAALLPSTWTCRLIDRNVADLMEADLAWADLVMTGGMNVQRHDCLAVIERVHRHGKPVVVGGPDVTSQPDAYDEADFVVCGEAEGVMAALIAAWDEGQRHGTFVAERSSVDVGQTPVPRFDLVSRQDYLFYSIQFSRGCPFTCEFCDIIELYGRVPRVKTVEQFLGELDALYRSGYRGHLDFVDDNFIGNKKAVKTLLAAMIEWQRARGYPFWLSTEASLNLADDADLLALMRQANFGLVFIGIETPDIASLVATRKKQNTRRHIPESVHRIQDAGMLVVAGFIVGFDTDPAEAAAGMIACIREAAIPACMVGLLVALPNTQLYRRLQTERRLFSLDWLVDRLKAEGGDQCILGLNFETLRPRRDVLSDYRRVLDDVYSPRAYFARVRDVVGRFKGWPLHGAASEARPRWHLLGVADAEWRSLLRLMWGALGIGPRTLFHVVRLMVWAVRTDPRRVHPAGVMAAFYLHLGPFAGVAAKAASSHIATIDRGEWLSPPLEPMALGEAAPGGSRFARLLRSVPDHEGGEASRHGVPKVAVRSTL